MNAEYLYRKSWTSSKSPTSAHISQRQTSKDIKMPAVSESHESSQRPDLISIPQLSPDLEDADRYSVQAVVTLVWPFSSSNRVFSLLLAEPDFRLRNQNGQIRVTFSGRCAEEVACTKVGIGDTVTLSLQGAQWTENQKTQSTPGKSLAWELQYKTQVKFEATRNGKKIAALDFEQPASPKQDALNDEPTTPALFPDRLPSPVLSQERWETPAFMRMKRLRSRSPVPSSTYDIFAEEDGYIPGLGRKRLRFSFPSSEWRLLNEPDDRTEDLVGNDENWFDSDEELLGLDADADGDMASAAPTYEAEQPTGTIPHTSFAGDVVGDNVQLAESDTSAQKVQIICDNVEEIQIRTSFLEETAGGLSVPDTRLSFATPRLDPIASSTLPTPSPLVYTPIDSPKPSNGASSNIPTSQPQSSRTGIINSIDDNTHSNVSSDAYNKGPSGVAESDESDAQTRTDSQELKANFQSVYVELNSPAIINDRNSLQSTHEQPLYLEQTRTNEFAGENDDKSTASDADGLENMNETEGDGDGAGLELIQGGRIGQSEGESTNAYHSVSEDGAEGGLGGSESEDVDDETSLHAEIIEVDDSSPVGHRREFRDVEKDENGESDFEGRCFSDDVEGDEEDIMSEQSEQSEQSDTGTGYEEGSADEAHQGATASRTAHRIVHPEVIVLDSDSEDEPHIVAAPSTKNGNDAVNDTENSSHIDDDDDRSTSWGVDNLEERNEYSEGEEEEETDEEMVPSETDIPEYENTSDEHMLLHDVYDLGETGYAQAEEGDEHDAPTNGMDEILSSQSGPESVTPRFDTPKVRSTPSATSNTSSVDNDMAREEQENGSLVNTENIPDASNDFGVKEAPGGQIPVQERVSGSTHLAQQLAYRNVSPLPVSTPPSTVNEKLQYNHLESTVLTSSDHDSSPSSEVAEPEAADGNRHRRWIDGSDERPLRDSDRRLSTEENTVHHFTEEDEIASEKLDEVVLVEDHISRPTGTDNHPVDEIKQCDFQNDLMPSIVETTKPQVYYSLATLVTRLHRPVDVIAVVVDASPAELSTTKTEGYDMRLRVTDGSMAGTTVIVNIFHPTEASLPRVTEGDAVLLHAFEVQTHNSSIELLSSDESGWAVIRSPADLPRATHSNVVFGEYERVYAEKLQNWFREDGAAMAADHMLQLSISQEQKQPSPFSAASSDAGSLESSRSGPVSRPRPRRRKSHRRVTIHELRDGRRYTEFGWLDSDSIHELRDGTVYAHSFGRDG